MAALPLSLLKKVKIPEKKFPTSFKVKSFDKNTKSFNDKYPFINENAEKVGLELMTIEDLALYWMSEPNFLTSVLQHLSSIVPHTRNIIAIEDKIEQYGILGETSLLLGKSGKAFVKSEKGEKLTKDDQESIFNFAKKVSEQNKKNWEREIGQFKKRDGSFDWKGIYDFYKYVFSNPQDYGFSLPGSASDLLKETLFKDLFRNFLTKQFVTLCMRGGKKEIGDEYIQGIVENALSDIDQTEKNHIVIVTVDIKTKEILSFIGAEKGLNNDIHGELICTKEDSGKSGIGKLQMAAVLLCAKETNVNFVFIQAIQGIFGVQSALYSRFGFETTFPPELLVRKTALEQCMFNPKSELKAFGNSEIAQYLDRCRIEYFKNPNPINWIMSMPSRMVASFTMIPMWIFVPIINPECIKNMIEKKGWDCRVGPIGGQGGRELIDSNTYLGKLAKIGIFSSFLQPSPPSSVDVDFGIGMGQDEEEDEDDMKE